MKILIYLSALMSFSALASVVGISTHPLKDRAKVLSAEMTGYMSRRQEMGAGIRYTQELDRYHAMDFAVSGAQDSQAMIIGTGVDFELLSEDVYAPRISIKPYYQNVRFEADKSNLIGAAPTLRKGFSFQGQEIFPFVALPSGFKIDNSSDEFVYYASLSFGASMPLPGTSQEKFLLSLEGNKDLGASSDYLGCLISWVWN